MEFNVKVWRGYYDQINILGQYLKDSRPDWEGNPPKFTISLQERKQVEDEIKQISKLSSDYLDKCKLHPHEPKWVYNPRNETTWASSEKFIFHHFMPKKKYLTVRF